MSELEGTGRSGWGRSVLSTGTRVLAGSSVKRRVKGPLASPGPAELVFSAVYLGPFRTEDGPAGETVANKSTFARFLQAIVWFFLQSKHVMVMSTGTNGQLGGSKKQKSVII